MEEKTDNIQPVWTELDFERMEWHDCRIYGFASYPESFEVAFDIDYICEWIGPIAPSTRYEFRTAPATLVFWKVRDLVIEVDSWDVTLKIFSIKRTLVGAPINSEFIDRQEEWEWLLELEYGQIRLYSVGVSGAALTCFFVGAKELEWMVPREVPSFAKTRTARPSKDAVLARNNDSMARERAVPDHAFAKAKE
jgi:hypothetical protein